MSNHLVWTLVLTFKLAYTKSVCSRLGAGKRSVLGSSTQQPTGEDLSSVKWADTFSPLKQGPEDS